jgi:Xaa-Pro aminopeptidase
MQVLQTTLLTGPYDWDPAVLPRAEFDGRLQRVRAALAGTGAKALLVNGHAGDYGALAYLTGFVPKLDSAIALVPMEGDIRLLVAGTALMVPQAKLLTWVEDVRPLANVPTLVAEFLAEKEGAALATWGAGSMAHRLYRGIAAAVGPMAARDDSLDPIRRRKSPRERALMGEASRILAAASSAFAAAVRDGAGVRTAALAAEREAVARGAQDARTLASLGPGGTPLPLDGREDPVLDPCLAAIAVKRAGYWAAGQLTCGKGGAALPAAERALAAMLGEARPGATGAALLDAAAKHLAPLAPHRATQGAAGHAIGLSLEEGPALAGDTRLETGACYALRVGAQGQGTDAALVSAMVAMNDDGAETL